MNLNERVNPIIVNYRTPDLTVKCVKSILKMGVAARSDIIVVDNASPDDSFARLKQDLAGLRVIRATHNAGFSAGINVGAAVADREYLLVLNPDTYFVDRSLACAISILDEQADVGLIGLNLIHPDGSHQYSGRRFYSVLDIVGRRLPLGRYWPLKRRVDRHMMVKEWECGVPFDADWVMGGGFIVRRELFEQTGRMDEAYFLYMEDVDLCARVWGAGYRVVCVPEARLVHDYQRSSATSPFSSSGWAHLQSFAEFRRKHPVPLLFPPGIDKINSSARVVNR